MLSLILLMNERAFAGEATWLYLTDDSGKRRTEFHKTTPDLKFHAELIGHNENLRVRGNGLEQLRAMITIPSRQIGNLEAEFLGHNDAMGSDSSERNVTAFIRHRYSFTDSSLLNVAMISQLYAPGPTRNLPYHDMLPSLSVPLNFRINKRNSTGISATVEQTDMQTDSRKYMLSWYYNLRLSPQWFSNFNIFMDRSQQQEHFRLSQLNMNLNYQLNQRIALNIGSYTALGQDETVFNHMVGTSFIF